MKESDYVQQPQDYGYHYDAIHDRLDRSLHRYEIDEPEQDTHNDQNRHQLK